MGDRLAEKVAFVTGVGSSGPGWGTGKATAVAFAREGARVFGFDRSRDAAEETRKLIAEEGGDCTVFEGDVTSDADVKHAVDTCVSGLGAVDILVNNVGVGDAGGPVEMSPEAWDQMFAVNLKSAFNTLKHCLPVMLEAKKGSIVNVSSMASLRLPPKAPMACYASSKAAMNGMSRSIAVQYAPHGIRCNTILPGLLDTPMVSAPLRKHFGEDLTEVMAARAKLVPMGHMGDAWDIAHAAVYLASDEAKYVTGIELIVDGGVNCWIGPSPA